jgi:hypothetical protein
VLEHKNAFQFSTRFCKHFHPDKYLRSFARDMNKNVCMSSGEIMITLFDKNEICRQKLALFSVKCHENPFRGFGIGSVQNGRLNSAEANPERGRGELHSYEY